MKNYIIAMMFLSLIVQIPAFAWAGVPGSSAQNDTIIVLDSAKYFIEFDSPVHAIAFDSKNKLYAGGKNKVYYIDEKSNIRLFATLSDTSSKTFIWGMTFDQKGNLYLAAHDRIVKIDSNGIQETIIKENYGGPCGATDVRIDSANYLYIVYDNIVAQYDTLLNKKIIVDGENFNPPIKWAVGIELDNRSERIFIGDGEGNKLLIVPFKRQAYAVESKIILSSWGQYLTKDEYGNIFLSMHGPETFPEFLYLDESFHPQKIFLKSRPLQNERLYKKAIAYGKHCSRDKGIYCIIGNKIYIYPISDI
ncbi:MAG TPA: hypothetical protein VHO46_06940 [Bacteroidales bacterium]|nr:hypothetical protein [Bacteroidales bacterium]